MIDHQNRETPIQTKKIGSIWMTAGRAVQVNFSVQREILCKYSYYLEGEKRWMAVLLLTHGKPISYAQWAMCFSVQMTLYFSLRKKKQSHSENKPFKTWGGAEYISHLTFLETLPPADELPLRLKPWTADKQMLIASSLKHCAGPELLLEMLLGFILPPVGICANADVLKGLQLCCRLLK